MTTNLQHFDNFIFAGYTQGKSQDNGQPFYTLSFLELDNEKKNIILNKVWNPAAKTHINSILTKFNLTEPFVNTFGVEIGDKVEIELKAITRTKYEFSAISKIIKKGEWFKNGVINGK